MADRGSVLRPLHAAAGDLALLRSGTAEPDAQRGALLRATNAVENSLRRLLRDEEGAPLELRLRALAPDELPAPEVVAGLRQQGRLSIEFAAALHELWGMRRRLTSGHAPVPGDAQLLLRIADRLEQEAFAPPAWPSYPGGEDRTQFQPVSPSGPVGHVEPPVTAGVWSRRRVPSWAPAAAGVLLLLLLLGGWWLLGRSDNDLETGVERFESGQVEQAVPHFRRYAEANPEDPTPRLYLARIHRRAGRFPEAAEELRYAQRAAPEDPGVQRELGFLLLDSGRSDRAIPHFRTAVEQDAKAADGWVGLVRALRTSGQAAAAERVLLRAPDEVRALLAEQPPIQPPTAPPTVP